MIKKSTISYLCIGLMLVFNSVPAIKGSEYNKGKNFAMGAMDGIGASLNRIRDGLPVFLANLGQGLKGGFEQGSELDNGMRQAFGNVTQIMMENQLKLAVVGLGVTITFLVAHYGIPLVFRMIEKALNTPKLIIASSKKTMIQYISSLFNSKTPQVPMVFAPKLEDRLNKIVQVTSTINTKIKQGKTNVKYRNLMLYGPPGTGKTMFAQELARRSGMEYAFMSGSSFSKFKDGEGIQALDELFAWAKKSKGLLIFIDEAETFLSKRENMDPQSKAYQLLNNFLNYTGERSNKFMLVFATNHKEALDSAMYRRIDDLIQMPLPGKDARMGILNLYIHKILMDEKQNGKEFVASVIKVLTPAKIEEIAIKTKGLSGGDLEGIINAIKTDTDISNPAIITQKLVDTIVLQAIEKHIAFTDGILLGEVED